MTIVLKSEQLAWLEAQVRAGRFRSIECAVDTALVCLMSEIEEPGDEDDDWVAPLLDEARASDARGESISLDEFKAHMERRRSRRA